MGLLPSRGKSLRTLDLRDGAAPLSRALERARDLLLTPSGGDGLIDFRHRTLLRLFGAVAVLP
jgi:hypothetical protein